MRQDYYLRYYHLERTNWWFMARERILSDQISKLLRGSPKKKETLKILNVGAATFRSSEMLREYGKVTSLEYNQECVDFVMKELGEEMLTQSVTNLEIPDGTFDLVCAFDVVEHVEQDKKAVSEMIRVCKPDGHVVFTVPALMSLWSHHDVINHHCRRYTLKGFLDIIPKNKCAIVKKSYFNFFLFPFIYLIRRFTKEADESESRSDFDKYDVSFINKLLYRIFLTEKWYLRKFNFAVGVSILFVGKKI